MTNQRVSCFQFDDIRVQPRNFQVSKAEATLPLEPKTFLILVFLIENRDRLVEKQELLDAIWKDVAVTENALTREIGKLRKSLGDDPKAAKYIQTVHTRGYRFIADVQVFNGVVESPSAVEPVAEPRRRSTSWLSYKFLAGLSITALLVAGGLLLRKPAKGTKAPLPKSAVTTLAVLPFRSLGAGADDPYVGLGMADALITKLSNSRQLEIEPLSVVMHYVDPKSDSLAIGRAMHVDYVLEGKFQKLGDRMRVTVQLLSLAGNGASRWAASFDETSGDIFQVQDSISQRVTASLPLELSGEEQKRMAKRETSSPEAQLAFAKGTFFFHQDNKESLEKAIDNFQIAVRRDPNYAMAWAWLSDGYRRREWFGGSPADFLPLARQAAATARRLNDTVAYTHSMLGLIAFQYDWDFAAAEREFRRARELQPSWNHQWHARYLLTKGRVSEAEAEYRPFADMRPFSASGRTNFAQFRFLTGQYPRALEQLRDILEAHPDYAPALELMGLVYEQQGFSVEALAAFQQAIDLSRGLNGLAALGHFYAARGQRAEAQRVLQQLEAQRKQRYVAPFELALIHAGMSDNAKAMDDLEKAYAERSLSAQSLRFDPRLSKVRTEHPYREFAKRIGLE